MHLLVCFLNKLQNAWRNDKDFKQSCRGKQNTQFTFNTFFLLKIVLFIRQCRKHGRSGQATDDYIISRMRIACWITKAANTHSEYVILIAFGGQ